ncbi:MAG TPA: dienelactone hydrolase family protein [Kineosporiaceae bacterium]|nr:dienelactone hydrolase family protein [Kineosporiaceae bacterium]
MTGSAPTADLTGWTCTPFTAADRTHDVYEKGTGPGVVLIPEIPGITPQALGLAEHLVQRGFTVVVPSPFGNPGRAESFGYIAQVFARLCVSSEFRAFATGADRPIAHYLRAVAADLAARTPGSGVGVIGMCFTGGFALAAAVDDSVLASVMSQPSVPLPLGKARSNDPGLSEAELRIVADRAARADLSVMGLRFSEDPACRKGRFDALKDRLGDAFEVIELDSTPGNPGGFAKSAHSVLTREIREAPDNLAAQARERVVQLLTTRLNKVVN